MADFTWPFEPDRDFAPEAYDEAMEFNVELSVARSGRVSTQSLPGARWRTRLAFPAVPVSQLVQRRQLEAFFLQQRGGADRLLLWNLQTPAPLGTARGAITLSAATALGATTATLTGALSQPNMMNLGGFEMDSDANGLADGWLMYQSGNTGFVGAVRVAGNGSTWAQQIDAAALGPLATDIIGVGRVAPVAVTAGQPYVFSCDTKDSNLTVVLQVNWYTAGDVLVSSTTQTFAASGSSWARRVFATAAPATAAKAYPYVLGRAQVGGPTVGAINVDNAQFEPGATASPYAGPASLLRGDRVAFAGQRVVLTADALANDAGAAMAISFQPAMRTAASLAAAVTLVKPTTRYVMAQPVVQMSAQGGMLPGFAVELVEE